MVKLLLGSFAFGAVLIIMVIYINLFKMIWEDYNPFTAFVLTVAWIMCIVPLIVTFIIYIFSLGG